MPSLKQIRYFLTVADLGGFTPAGAVYRDRVLAVDKLLGAAAEEGGQLARGEASVLRLLHSSSIPASSLIQPISRFLDESPKARIELDRVGSEVQVSEVANGKADIGILRPPVLRRDPGVVFVELATEPLCAASPNIAGLALCRHHGEARCLRPCTRPRKRWQQWGRPPLPYTVSLLRNTSGRPLCVRFTCHAASAESM